MVARDQTLCVFLVSYSDDNTWYILRSASDREIRTGYIKIPFTVPGELLMVSKYMM